MEDLTGLPRGGNPVGGGGGGGGSLGIVSSPNSEASIDVKPFSLTSDRAEKKKKVFIFFHILMKFKYFTGICFKPYRSRI